ncbi:ATP-binding protein [Tenacibaculum piscium]|nr:ATP-binding protein [Tenacibaculum piscium]MBE7685461.1 ATP-binding protein [Tenacibaculum piscium]
MINKRLLIKNLLAHNDENTFYDKKQEISLASKEGKAKFIKLVCALSNSNPTNNSYIVIGVEDEENKIIGVDFYDDSKIQNLVNAYLKNPPKITYENVAFPRLQRHKVLGLVTIFPNNRKSFLLKNSWKYLKNTGFYRQGSNSVPFDVSVDIPIFKTKNARIRATNNADIVKAIQKNASNNIELTLAGVFDFINNHEPKYHPQYKVFKEQFVLCWAGKKKMIHHQLFYTRVDIELINEQVRLFFSSLDAVQIRYNEQSFIITEYIALGIDKTEKQYPLEQTSIHFKDNGKYIITTNFLFKPPLYNSTILKHIYDKNNQLLLKILQNKLLTTSEKEAIYKLPTSYLICSLHGFLEAPNQLKKAKKYFKSLKDKTTYIKYKEVMRVLRKVKHHQKQLKRASNSIK